MYGKSACMHGKWMTTHEDTPVEYMGGQLVGNDDYLLVAINHSPGDLMLLRCCLEGICPQ